METRKSIARNATEHRMKIAGPDMSTSHETEAAWAPAVASALRSIRQATAPAQTRQDRAGPTSATTEALTALEAAAVAATEVAERVFSLAEVLDEAMAVLADARRAHPGRTPSRGAAPGVAVLSPREQQVLALVAEGRTNKMIADVLSVSPNTIKTHVTSLLTKLHADSRAELAAIAVRRGLG